MPCAILYTTDRNGNMCRSMAVPSLVDFIDAAASTSKSGQEELLTWLATQKKVGPSGWCPRCCPHLRCFVSSEGGVIQHDLQCAIDEQGT